MKNIIQQYKPFLLFLGKFALTYLLLTFLYQSYLGQFDVKKAETDGFTKIVASQTEFLLQLVDDNSYTMPHLQEPSVKLIYHGKYIARIIEGCNAVSVMILFIAFVVAFTGKLKNTILFILIGLFVIHLLNIIRIGTSGTIQQDIPIDSFLMSHLAIGFEGLFNFYPEALDFESELAIEVKHAFKAFNPYVFEMDHHLGKYFSAEYQFGITATLGGFYGPQGRAIRLSSGPYNWMQDLCTFDANGRKITNIEMETAGIYGLSKMLGHSAISLNAILANRITGAFSKNPQKTIDELSVKSLNIIDGID